MIQSRRFNFIVSFIILFGVITTFGFAAPVNPVQKTVLAELFTANW